MTAVLGSLLSILMGGSTSGGRDLGHIDKIIRGRSGCGNLWLILVSVVVTGGKWLRFVCGGPYLYLTDTVLLALTDRPRLVCLMTLNTYALTAMPVRCS